MEDQAHQQPQAAATQEIGDLSSTTGPSTTQVLRVVMLVLLSGVLLLLAGITLLGTLIGLTVTAPLFILFSPVLIPAVLTIGLVATGFLTVVAFVLTALFFFMRMNSPRTRMREQYTIPGGELKDAGALNSLTSLGPSDSRPSASVDNGKGKRVMVVDQQQQNNGKRTHRKAVDLDASSLSATSMESNIYHVFLSFSGRDTRKQFTDHLYHGLVNSGISTFRDNMLTVGEKFSANLFHAIKNSKISVPVISQSYASSIWCLQELALMVECMKSSGHVILPIFYRVEPSDVRHQKGDFGELFSHSTEKYEKKDVEKWKQALHKVADLNGWPSEMTADGREAELVKLVVTRVWSELKKAFQLVVDPEQPVGIDNAVEEVLRLLVNPNATKIVCIHGMGGIGKTTLAKVIYNKLLDQFLHHSFITNIRGNKILSLQNQLICDILKTKDEEPTTDQTIRTMEFGFKLRKVLILLDDVDHIDQVKSFVGKHEWFEKGSRIIITTRIKSILKDDEVICNYELKEIDEHQSLILFSRHAFLKDSPLRKFASLSDQIINITGRLPLALKVIGSFLCGKDIAFWERTLEKLKEVQPKDVKEKLEISYNALEPEEQQIFLDIACFFIGTDLRIASYMWKACRFFSAGIDTLINMSLIKIGDNHELIMHN